MDRLAWVVAGLLSVAVSANAATHNNIRVKVIDSETHSVTLEGRDVPTNCDQVNFDAYCNNSKTAVLTNTLLVQEGDQPPFRVTCTIDSRFSRCMPLPRGESFDAKREKRGVVIYYIDDKGKARSQLYTLVDTGAGANTMAAAVAAAPAPAPTRATAPALAPTPRAAAPVNTPANATASPTANAQPVAAEMGKKVICNFSSTPAGAEITLDGQYVGNTPSEIGLGSGNHVVVFSLPGFAQWKRELTVLPQSELTVSATLQKQAQ